MNLKTKMIKESLFPLTRIKFLVMQIEKDLAQIDNIYKNPLVSLIDNLKDISDAVRIEYVANLMQLGITTQLKAKFTNLDNYYNLLDSSYDKFLQNIDQSHSLIIEELASYKDLLTYRESSHFTIERFLKDFNESVSENSSDTNPYLYKSTISAVESILKRQREINTIFADLEFIKNERIISAAQSLSKENTEFLSAYLKLANAAKEMESEA